MRSETTSSRAQAGGSFVRTHVLRPTWHYVAAEDAAWLIEVTAPRVRGSADHVMREVFGLARDDAEAAAFCVNAVNLDARIVMAKAPDSLRAKLRARGYSLTEVDLSPFILSGGAAYCMTLRLDRTSVPAAHLHAAE